MSEYFTKNDHSLLERTLVRGRKMRNAAVMAKRRGLSQAEVSKSEQEVLSDAERLMSVAARLMVAYINGLSQAEVRDELREELDNTIRYHQDDELTSFGSPPESILYFLKSDAVMLSLPHGWEQIIRLQYVNGNNLSLDPDQLMTPGIGVVAPLTSDYMRSSLHRKFFEANEIESFELKPAAPFSFLGEVVLPRDGEGNPVFLDKEGIAIYIDTPGTGETARTVLRGLGQEYPSMPIYSSHGSI